MSLLASVAQPSMLNQSPQQSSTTTRTTTTTTTTTLLNTMTTNNNSTETTSSPKEEPLRVVVVGAGPGGLLLTLALLQQNKDFGTKKYQVTLVESRADLGSVSLDELHKQHRSWMIGLAAHGLEAVKEISPTLYKDYVRSVGVRLNSVSLHLGKSEMKVNSGEEGQVNENFIVDRNYIVAALARCLQQEHLDANNGDDESSDVEVHYDTQVMYVDSANKRVLVRPPASEEDENDFYIPYDLLVGADGIRSTVRNVLVQNCKEIEVHVEDIFQHFKAVHIDRPESVDADSMHILPNCLPNMMGIALPEKGGNTINMTIGCPRHLFDKMPDAIKSSDPKVVAQFFDDNFQAFPIVDRMDLAEQWVAQRRWNRTGQVHCNMYHHVGTGVAILGDAAHATSPSIGMGMNTALRDAAALARLLKDAQTNSDVKNGQDILAVALPQFSNERVKEGQSLSDLAFHLYCLDTNVMMMETIHSMIRGSLFRLLPKSWQEADNVIWNHPQAMLGNTKYSLTDVYRRAHALGIIPKHRRINNAIRQAHLELTTGMIVDDGNNKRSSWLGAIMLLIFVTFLLLASGTAMFDPTSAEHSLSAYMPSQLLFQPQTALNNMTLTSSEAKSKKNPFKKVLDGVFGGKSSSSSF